MNDQTQISPAPVGLQEDQFPTGVEDLWDYRAKLTGLRDALICVGIIRESITSGRQSFLEVRLRAKGRNEEVIYPQWLKRNRSSSFAILDELEYPSNLGKKSPGIRRKNLEKIYKLLIRRPSVDACERVLALSACVTAEQRKSLPNLVDDFDF